MGYQWFLLQFSHPERKSTYESYFKDVFTRQRRLDRVMSLFNLIPWLVTWQCSVICVQSVNLVTSRNNHNDMTHITHSNFLTHHDTTGSQEIFNYEFYLLIMILQILGFLEIFESTSQLSQTESGNKNIKIFNVQRTKSWKCRSRLRMKLFTNQCWRIVIPVYQPVLSLTLDDSLILTREV